MKERKIINVLSVYTTIQKKDWGRTVTASEWMYLPLRTSQTKEEANRVNA